MLSIIIPACNEENYLKETIQSIRDQEFLAYEIIVVSDASEDNTDKIATKHADKFLRLEKRQGPAAAKNAGAHIARGDIFVFLDADTHLTPGILEEISTVTKDDLVGTCKAVPSNKKLHHQTIFKLRNSLLCPVGVSNGIVFCNKKTFEQYGTYPDLKKREEGKFIRNVMKTGEFKILDKEVILSTRRFEQLGYAKVILYWLKEELKPTTDDYPIVR